MEKNACRKMEKIKLNEKILLFNYYISMHWKLFLNYSEALNTPCIQKLQISNITSLNSKRVRKYIYDCVVLVDFSSHVLFYGQKAARGLNPAHGDIYFQNQHTYSTKLNYWIFTYICRILTRLMIDRSKDKALRPHTNARWKHAGTSTYTWKKIEK